MLRISIFLLALAGTARADEPAPAAGGGPGAPGAPGAPGTPAAADPSAPVPDAPAPVPDAPVPVPDAPAPAAAAPAEPDWSAAPPPAAASGIARPAPTPVSHHLLWAPRAVLFVPRWAFWVAAQPIRLGAWAYERYQLPDRFKRSLFNVDQTFGIYPVASVATTFGVSGGLRFVHRNVLGRRERLRLGATFGGEFRQAYGANFRSGERFAKWLALELDVRYERRPNERFFGIGNAGELDGPPAMLIDPSVDDAAVDTQFRQDLTRAVLEAQGRLADSLALHVSAALTTRRFGTAGDDENNTTPEIYDTSRLVGFDGGVDNAYVEAELVYDTRRPTSIYQSRAVDATGWYASAYAAVARGTSGDPTRYWRYGAEAQRFFDLYRGSRVLALRAIVESVAGTDGRTDGKISFIDLPRLGGNEYLRGYTAGRFRDRALAMATAEYTWDLGNFLAAYLFADVGRVLPSLRDVTIDDSLRAGFGGGVQFHSRSSFIMRGQLAISRDRDVLVELVLSPGFGRRERAGRF